MDKRYIASTALKVYALLGAVVPYLLARLETAEAGAIVATSNFGCPAGWVDASREGTLSRGAGPRGRRWRSRQRKRLGLCIRAWRHVWGA